MINVYQPTLGKEELDALKDVFESNWLGKGKRVAEFEEKYASHLGVSKDLVLTTNCCRDAKAFLQSSAVLLLSNKSLFPPPGNNI